MWGRGEGLQFTKPLHSSERATSKKQQLEYYELLRIYPRTVRTEREKASDVKNIGPFMQTYMYNQMDELDRQSSQITDNVRYLLGLHENLVGVFDHGSSSVSFEATPFLSKNTFRESVSVDPLNEGYEQFKKRERLGGDRRSSSALISQSPPAFSNTGDAEYKVRLLTSSSRSRGTTPSSIIDRRSQVIKRTTHVTQQDFASVGTGSNSSYAQPFDRVVSVTAKVRAQNTFDNAAARHGKKGNEDYLEVNDEDGRGGDTSSSAPRHAHRRLDVLSAVSLYDNTRDTTIDNVRYDVERRRQEMESEKRHEKERKRKQLLQEQKRCAAQIEAAEELNPPINSVDKRNVLLHEAAGTGSDKSEEENEEDAEFISASPVARSVHESSPPRNEVNLPHSPISTRIGDLQRRQGFVDEASFVNTPPRNVHHVHRESARRKTWQRDEEDVKVKQEVEKRSPSYQHRGARFVGQPFSRINESNIVDASGLVNDSIFQQIDSALRATSLQKYSEEEKTEYSGRAANDQRVRALFPSPSPLRHHLKKERGPREEKGKEQQEGARSEKLEKTTTTRDGMKNIHYISTYLAKNETISTLEHSTPPVFGDEIVPPTRVSCGPQPSPPTSPLPAAERLASPSTPPKTNITASAARSNMSFDGDELSSPQPELPFPRRPPPPPFLNSIQQQPPMGSNEVTRPSRRAPLPPNTRQQQHFVLNENAHQVTAGSSTSSPSPPPPPPSLGFPPPNPPQDKAAQSSALETNTCNFISRRLLYSNSREQQQQQHLENATSSFEDKEAENIRANAAERNIHVQGKNMKNELRTANEEPLKSEDEGNSSVFFSAGGLGTTVVNRCKQ